MSESQVYEGVVVFFSNSKGYGFLKWTKDGQDQKDLFVHFSDINVEGYKTLKKDQKVSFEIGLNNKGLPKATKVSPI